MPLYERLAKTVFPNAQVVYDRFHIAKHLNDTMNHVRIHVYQRLCKGDRQAQKQARRIKHYWCILQVKSAEKCNDFLHSLAAHFLFYLVI